MNPLVYVEVLVFWIKIYSYNPLLNLIPLYMYELVAHVVPLFQTFVIELRF